MRRVHLRGRENILKGVLIHLGGFNLSLMMRQLLGKSTPRGLQGLSGEALLAFLRLWIALLLRIEQERIALGLPAPPGTEGDDIFILPATE